MSMMNIKKHIYTNIYKYTDKGVHHTVITEHIELLSTATHQK